jgi:hypothetical protein
VDRLPKDVGEGFLGTLPKCIRARVLDEKFDDVTRKNWDKLPGWFKEAII